MKIIIAMSVILFGFVLPPVHAQVNHVIIFGDSLSDSGNNTWFETNGYYKGSPLSSPDFQGNRYTWANYFVKDFNQQRGDYSTNFDLIPSRLSNEKSVHINYSWASAETSMHYLNDMKDYEPYVHYNDDLCKKPGILNDSTQDYCVPGVRLQVNEFISTYNNNPDYIKNSLFILMAGGNDIFNNLNKFRVGAILKVSLVGFNLDASIKQLKKAGVPAKNIVLLSIPNISLLPIVKNMVGPVQRIANGIAWSTKNKLSLISKIQGVHFYDPSLVLEQIVNHNQYTTVDGSETFYFPKVGACYFEPYDPNQHPIERNCNGYAFYDLKHPSNITHQALADGIWNYVKNKVKLRD